MKAEFEIGGYRLIIGGDYVDPTGQSSASPIDHREAVSMQILHRPLCGGMDDKPKEESIFYSVLKPSHARAVASAILSSATDARDSR